jgi:hypothetical protein
MNTDTCVVCVQSICCSSSGRKVSSSFPAFLRVACNPSTFFRYALSRVFLADYPPLMVLHNSFKVVFCRSSRGSVPSVRHHPCLIWHAVLFVCHLLSLNVYASFVSSLIFRAKMGWIDFHVYMSGLGLIYPAISRWSRCTPSLRTGNV